MIRRLDVLHRCLLAIGLASIAFLPGAAEASTFKVLHVFSKKIYGRAPQAGVIEDEAGNLYGTTDWYTTIDGNHSYGTVYKLAPDRNISVLYTFTGGNDGAFPLAALVRDRTGKFYGTTFQGGAGNGADGFGTAFKLAPDGTETVLHVFTGMSGGDGEYPTKLILGRNGDLYGLAEGGVGCLGYGCGMIFKLAPDGTETVLYAFKGGGDGWSPDTAPIEDKAGNLYGATYAGGGTGCAGDGCGTVYKIAPDGTETVLFVLVDGMKNGYGPTSLIAGKAGNFYGTTAYGGGPGNNGYGWGTIFEILPDGTENILYAFNGGIDGAAPNSLVMDKAGNFYGTTYVGGNGSCDSGCGTVFRFTQGRKAILHTFSGQRDGARPNGIIEDAAGNLVGTTMQGGQVDRNGGYGWGTVFEVTP